MLKLSKNGIGALTAQYRSVLKKCFILNMCAAGLMLFSAAAHAETGTIYDSDNWDRLSSFGTEVNPEELTATSPIALYIHQSTDATVNGYLTGEMFGSINQPWIKNYGTVGFGYTYDSASGTTQEYSGTTSIEGKHNITADYKGNGGGVLGNLYHISTDGSPEYAVLQVKNTTFENNSSTYFEEDTGVASGGAIENLNPQRATIENSKFVENYAMHFDTAEGGAVYNGSSIISGTEGTEVVASMSSSRSTFDGNVAGNTSSDEKITITDAVRTNIVNEMLHQAAELGHSTYSDHAFGGAIANEGIYLSEDDTFTNNIAIGSDAEGGAIYNNRYTKADGSKIGGVFTLDGDVTFEGNTAEGNGKGGAIYNNYQFTVESGADLQFRNNATTGNVASGGAVYNDSEGTINLSGDFVNNSAGDGSDGETASGGAIANAGNLSVSNATFQNNSVNTTYAYGGALYNVGTATLTESNLTGNYARNNNAGGLTGNNNGGAIYNGSGGSLNMLNNTLSGNYVRLNDNSEAFGGAVYNSGTIISSSDDYTSNTARSGGAVYNDTSGEIEITGGRMNDNSSVISGGAVYNEHLYTSTGVTYETNKANGTGNVYGGAIYNEGDVTVAGGDFNENRAVSTNKAAGGAIYNNSQYGGSIILQDSTTFDSNTAEGSEIAMGGAFYNDEDASIKTATGAVLKFVDNYAEAEEESGRGAGGAVYNLGEMNLKGAEFTGNSATGGIADGGAIYNDDTGTLVLSDASFENNSVSGIYDEGTPIAGGGAIANVGMLTASSSTFNGNSATGGDSKGGAIYNDENGTAVSTNNTYDANKADLGAAIYNEGNFTSTSDVIKNHTKRAVYNGYYDVDAPGTYISNGSEYTSNAGAVYNEGTFTSTGDKYTDNSADNGGAIYNSRTFTATNLTATGNQADSGGAIYNDDNGKIEITGGDFNGNKAVSDGNAYGGAINNHGDLTVKSSTFDSNTLTGTNTAGGAIYNTGTTVAEGNTYQDHKANSGGAVYNAGTFTSDADKYVGNSSQGVQDAMGGAIYNDTPEAGATAVFNMAGTAELNGNFAKATAADGQANGGAVYNNAEFNTDGNTLSFSNNYAEGNTAAGGAVFNDEDGVMSVAGTFANNYVNGNGEGSGGAVYNTGNLTIAEGTVFTDNKTTGDAALGGAIYNAVNSTLNVTGAEFTANTVTSTSTEEDALAAGGAIANLGSLTVTSSTFDGNTLTGVNTVGGAILNTGTTVAEGNTYQNHTANAGGAVYNEGTFTSDADKYIGNSAQGTEIALGGAIYNDTPDTEDEAAEISDADETVEPVAAEADGGVFNLKGTSEFNGNFAKATSANGAAAGGAIYNDAQFNTDGNALTLSENYAEGYTAAGGAIYNDDNGIMTIAGTFNENYADAENHAQGGAIYNSGELTIAQAAFNENHADGDIAEGGAVHTESTLNLENVEFNSNYASGTHAHGGALASEINDAANAMDIFASKFDGNQAKATTEGLGGALYNGNVNALTNIVDTDFTNNSVVISATSGTALGGAIYNDGAENEIAIMSLTAETADVSISGNEVKLETGSATTGEFYGGALFNGTYGKATIATEGGNITVANNKALHGGAIYNKADGKSVTVDGESISTNLEINAANGDITFSANEAAGNGGAIYNSTNDSGNQIGLYISATNGAAVNFAENSAVNGGALQNSDGSNARLILGGDNAEIKFSDNKATRNGGAINNDASKIEILNSATDATASATLTFASNTATYGGAISNVNGGEIVGTIKNDVTVMFDGNKSSPSDLSGAIYNDNTSEITLNIADTTKIVFNTDKDTVFNENLIKITGDNDSPVEREDGELKPDSVRNSTNTQVKPSFVNVDPENTQVVLNSTFTGDGIYDISNTQLNLGSTGFIDDGTAKILRYDPQMYLKNNEINLAENSFMYLTDYNDKLSNNDFYIEPNATLRFTDLFETNEFVLANHIENEGTVKYIAAQKDTDVRLGTSIINAGTIDVADSVLTNVHIGTLQSQEGNQIIIDLDNPNLKADIVTIDKRIYNATNTITSIYFADYNDKTDHAILAETELEVGERIYFAQTQSMDDDLKNTFEVVNGKNAEYEIKMGNEYSDGVWDWFLYREDEPTPPPPPPPPGPNPLTPEEIAAVDLPRAAVEQLRSIRLPISRTNRGQCSCYEDNCNNYYCQYENSPKTRLWATPFYKWGTYDAPIETDFKIWGVDFGMDYQPTSDDMIGIFGSYRNGEYENDGKGDKKNVFSNLGSKLDIDSWIGGLYYRRYFGNLYMLGSAFGGKLDVDMDAKDGVKASTDGYDVGAEIEMGYDIHSSQRSTWTPSLRGRYDHIKFDDWKDSSGKQAEFDALNHFEIEAALKYEYQFNSEHELPTTGYIKPSVIQTIASGGDVTVDGKEFKDTVDSETFGRIEIGADAEIVKNFSIGAFGNYTFGSKYDAWTVGGNVRYVW